MYSPTDEEKNRCVCIVKEVLRLESDSDCEQHVDEIFKTIYAIGGDYSEKTIRSVAKVLFRKM